MKAEKTKKRHKLKLKLKKRYIINQEKNKLRLCVFRSNKEIYAQIVDDKKGKVICSASSLKLDEKVKKGNKTDQAKIVGKTIAEKAKEQKVKDVFFDRNGFLYHGRIAALAEGARDGGLKF